MSTDVVRSGKYPNCSFAAALCAAFLLASSAAHAANPDVTGIVPTIWWDFETRPNVSGLASTNKGSKSISFTDEGTQTYQAGVTNGWAIDTSKYTPYSKAGTYSTAGYPITVSLVMTLGSNPNGITLNVRTTAGDLIIRRGATAGSLVVAFGEQQKDSSHFLNATLSGGDSAYHLVSVVGSSEGTKLYVDGVLADSSTAFTPWSASGKVEQMQFGSHLNAIKAGEARLGGCIDDLRIHEAALTAAQIKAIAAENRLVTFSDGLSVSGTPQNWGTVIPAYGINSGLSLGDTVECSAVGAETESTKTIPIGYSLYSVATDDSKTLVAESDATFFTYTHGSYAGDLVWHWAQSNRVSVAAAANGSVSEGGWVGYGESFSLTAVPNTGYKFCRWIGDTIGVDIRSASAVIPSVTAPRSIVAEFIEENTDMTVQYVSPDGDDSNAGYLATAPKKTIAAAVKTLASTAAASTQRGTVRVAPGLYPISTPIVVTNAISVIGDDPDPSRTVVSNTIGAGDKRGNQRIFTVNHADALVANLTMQEGSVWGDWIGGGNFLVDTAGGTVSNCLVEAGHVQWGGHCGGGGGRLAAGLVTHTVFRRNYTTTGSSPHGDGPYRAGVLMLMGVARAENCLIADNPQRAAVTLVRLDGNATMRNCTIVDSSLPATNDQCKVFTAIRINSANATVVNTVVAGVTNKIDGAACPPTGSVTKFLNGAFDGDVTELPVGTVTGTAATFFKDYGSGDYRPKTGGVLVNKGQNYEPTPAKDLGGNKRLIGSKIDIGCYEANAAELCIRVR